MGFWQGATFPGLAKMCFFQENQKWAIQGLNSNTFEFIQIGQNQDKVLEVYKYVENFGGPW